MPNLTLSNEQVIDLFKQLPEDQKREVYKILILSQSDRWESLSKYAIDKARIVAKERGYDWDTMTEEEKEEFVDNIVHEK
ncbi:hypothetical protein PN437_05480 [Microcystis aeruginosa CS-564/01]|uniref:hypothetical protein n=1 Tax=Microcystis aeruginosa TaxID=1126 RepID=UPI002330155A|nr:hypothetical protein [Microcystis aeruginosa]MDB9424369.1 hypothetical protein [Microcystis aeruginosa CS-564/01]